MSAGLEIGQVVSELLQHLLVQVPKLSPIKPVMLTALVVFLAVEPIPVICLLIPPAALFFVKLLNI